MMPTNSALSTQEISISFPTQEAVTPLRRVRQALASRSRARFAAIAGLSFALTLPALGVVDPDVLMASSLSYAQAVDTLVSRADVALHHMDVLGLFATGGIAVLALAAMAGVGYLRARHKEARELPVIE